MRWHKHSYILILILLLLMLIPGCALKPKVAWDESITDSTIFISKWNHNANITIYANGKVDVYHDDINEGKLLTFNLVQSEVESIFNYVVNEKQFFRLKKRREVKSDIHNQHIMEEMTISVDGKTHEVYWFGYFPEEVYSSIREMIYTTLEQYYDLSAFDWSSETY